MNMWGIVQCPSCKSKNEINVDNWERVKCYSCEDIFYVEIVSEIKVGESFGKDAEATEEGFSID